MIASSISTTEEKESEESKEGGGGKWYIQRAQLRALVFGLIWNKRTNSKNKYG